MGLLTLMAAGAVLCMVVGAVIICQTMLFPARRTYAYALAHGLAADPADLGLNADEMTFHFRDGTHSPGWIIHGRVADGPVVVVTHGWSSSRYLCLPRAALLAQLASSVVIYDVRGHGDASARMCRLATREVDDLRCVIEQLPFECSPLVLYGSSLGAGVSLVTAAGELPCHVDGVICEGPYRHALEPVVGQLRCRGYPPYPVVWIAGLMLAVILGGNRRFDRVIYAARLSCPLLVMHGGDDPICPPASGRQIAEAASHGQFVPFPGARHGRLADYDPRRYLGSIERFLNIMRKEQRRVGQPD